MIALRKDDPVLADPHTAVSARSDAGVLEVVRRGEHGTRRLVVNFLEANASVGAGAVLVTSKALDAGELPPSGAALLATDEGTHPARR
jgi:hypothetical protein